MDLGDRRMTAHTEPPDADRVPDAGNVPEPEGVPPEVAARLLRALDQAPNLVVSLLSSDLTTSWMSSSAQWVTDTDPAARRGRRSLEEIHPDDKHRILHGMVQLWNNTKAGRGSELTIEPLRYRKLRRDGSWITMEALVQNFLDDPVVDGLLIVSRPAGGEVDSVGRVVDLLVADAPLAEVLAACARLVPDFLGYAAVVGLVDGTPVIGVDEDSPAALLVKDERWWRSCLEDGRMRTAGDYQGFPDDLAATALAEGFGCAWAVPLRDRTTGQVMGCVIVWITVPAEYNLGTEQGLRQTMRLASLVLGEHRRQRSLRREAATDPLTGVGNRSALRQRLDAAPGEVAIALFDMDDFKPVNDTHGHDVGDAVLHAVADRLVAAVRSDDLVVRFGGDEFAVVFAEGTTADGVAATTERLLAAIARPMPCEAGPVVTVTASVGVAFGRADRVVQQADAALYEAKRARLGDRSH
jgi:diguanylate cyclase (GGDEF)-like protein